MNWLKQNKNKVVLWGLLVLVVMQGFLILSYAAIDNTEIADLKAQIEYKDKAIEEFKKYNDELAEECRKHCPGTVVTETIQ
jgi:cell division protein FtsL